MTKEPLESSGIDELEIIERYYRDFPAFAEDFLYIRSRAQKLEPLKLNAAQMICHKILTKQLNEQGYVRALILKARRLGMSTYVESRFYHRAIFNELQNVYIVSHRDDSCNVLFNMTKLMQEKNPLRPGTIASNRKELRFRATRSEYAFSSADSPEAAKSRDITLFHGSEVAEWRQADDLLGALMPCLPKPPVYSEAILESTANGYGNTFQKMVFRAYAEGAYPYYRENGFTYAYHAPGYEWILIFFPWFVHAENRMEFRTPDERRAFEAYLTKKVYRKDLGIWSDHPSLELMKRHGLSLEQMNWMFWTLRNDCNDDEDKFRQEHPGSVLDAFVSTGGNVFSADLCDELSRRASQEKFECRLIERSGRVVAKIMPGGNLKIWEGPEPDADYLVSVDPAGGMRELQADKNDPDFTCMDVWRREGRVLVQVAQWHGQIDYDLIGDEAIMLARLYNWAAISVLRMNHGLAVLTVLRRQEWPRIVQDDDGKPGILEDRKRKVQMVDDTVRALRDSEVVVRSQATIEELRTYIERDRKMAAEEGCKDDRVSSLYCAVYTNLRLPKPSKLTGKSWMRQEQKKASTEGRFVLDNIKDRMVSRGESRWTLQLED